MGKAVEHNQTDLPTATFPGETVAKAIRRLAGGDVGKKRQQAQRKLQQKIKTGQVSKFFLSQKL